MTSMAAPESLLPLPPATFHILLALADDDRHGYGIILDVVARTGGKLKLSPGTLYRSGIHPARPAEARPGRSFDHGRAGLAQDAGRRAGLRHRLIPALRVGRGQLPFVALVHRTARARHGDGDRGVGWPDRTRRGTWRSGSLTCIIT